MKFFLKHLHNEHISNAAKRLISFCGIALYCFFRLLLAGPAHCRFHPTCGPYTIAQLKEQPLIPALRAIIKRVWHCSPWGSYDC